MITGIAHINIVVPSGTLDLAKDFYSGTLGFQSVSPPAIMGDVLAWFDITPRGQQVHVAFGEPSDFAALSSRHPCFQVESAEALSKLQTQIWEHFERGGPSAPVMADKPGGPVSGTIAGDTHKRFFARDYAGNRLEFSV